MRMDSDVQDLFTRQRDMEEQHRHQPQWGTTVPSSRIAGNNSQQTAPSLVAQPLMGNNPTGPQSFLQQGGSISTPVPSVRLSGAPVPSVPPQQGWNNASNQHQAQIAEGTDVLQLLQSIVAANAAPAPTPSDDILRGLLEATEAYLNQPVDQPDPSPESHAIRILLQLLQVTLKRQPEDQKRQQQRQQAYTALSSLESMLRGIVQASRIMQSFGSA